MTAHRTSILAALAGLAALLLAGATLAATPVPSGRWSFTFTDARGHADRPLRVFTYRPKRCDASCPLVFVLHGARRNAYPYIGHWELAADRHSFIIVAPEFSRERWPRAAAYELGEVATQAEPSRWTYSVLEHLFDEVRSGQKGYAVFGHGAGARFVQRMAFFRADHRATLMVVANPDWHLLPEWRKEKTAAQYPYSLVGSPAGEAQVRSALARRVLLLVAPKDGEPDDENLGQAAGAKLQGEGRMDRAETFLKAATASAGELGVPLGWELHELPATVGDAGAVSRAAAELMFPRR